jgi:hypothetical protein
LAEILRRLASFLLTRKTQTAMTLPQVFVV